MRDDPYQSPRVPAAATAGITVGERASTTVLEVRDLCVTYGRRRRSTTSPAVDRVSLQVADGEIVGVVGESGSGKSSLVLAVAGLVPHSRGEVVVVRQDVSARFPKHLRPEVQMIFQDPHGSLDPRQTIRGMLAELRALHPERSAWITDADLLAEVGLRTDLLDRLPHEISGGQAQRVSIARALLLRPRLLLADEPTSGLDVSVQAQILRLLMEIRQTRNVAILFISHDIAVVRRVCDRVYVMLNGQVVESGATESVLDDPQSEYTSTLLRAVPGQLWERRHGLPPAGPEGAP